ncbi:leucine-rich repeat-containing protein 15-like [Ruditapes philippinarum]|uniref:leucine-rich repeat-containing protein 15-like n=1 Tax=Ruditapes philippinarum TaxID=129788 RepID=UPI00295B9959|nr:leucine-rich repeat-containing protein 15-like [Ruditapes philippinarum]XP_060603421.1 leucine-rich repeat-containing protein 15-like [Ruditapes philippinarum]
MEKLILQACILISVVLYTGADANCPNGCSACSDGRLQCPGAGLNALPSPIPPDTFYIDLTQNNIGSLQKIPDLPELQSFRMSLNDLRVIKGGDFEGATSLMSLDLSMNSISKVYKHGFRGLENVETISLNGNKITEIGQILRNTPALKTLRLGNNEIEVITENDFEKNNMIKMLDLSHNKIMSIHGNAFKNMDMLRYLILSNNPITSLPDLTFSSTMLSLADFSNCQLENVPRTMPPSLTDYRLGNNLITSINDDDFNNITQLNLLTLNDNKINFIAHRSFGNLENLKELWLSRNDMVYIPRGLPQGLIKLFIDNNQVVELEPMLFKEDSKLKELSLEQNKVRKVHQDSLKYLNDLEKLNLQGNQISLIDVGTFTNLPKLEMLTLTDNPIQVFEQGAFAGLDSLNHLSMALIDGKTSSTDKILHENFLTTMPNLTTVNLMSSVGLTKAFLDIFAKSTDNTFENIKKVNLEYNELTTLPETVQTIFPNIKQLLLDGNLLHCDTKLLWLRAWMQTTTTVSFHQYEQPTCNTPDAVNGRLISELSPTDFKDVPLQQRINSNVQQSTETEVSEQPSSSVSRNTAPQSHDQDTPQNNGNNAQSSRQPSSTGGVRVIIKPPRNQQTSNPSKVSADKKQMTKAERKAARKAERERKRKMKEERRRQRRLSQKDKDAKRKKRRIHKKKGQRCKVDKDGNMKCVRRKRCKVDDQGNVVCRKRKGKGNKDKQKQ